MSEKVCKNGGAARRRFSAIREKLVGVVKMTPPPTRAKVKRHRPDIQVEFVQQGLLDAKVIRGVLRLFLNVLLP